MIIVGTTSSIDLACAMNTYPRSAIGISDLNRHIYGKIEGPEGKIVFCNANKEKPAVMYRM